MKYNIKVSEVKNGSENLKGLATVVLGDSFRLGNIMIMNDPKKDQLFVAMPSYKTNQVNDKGEPVFNSYFNPTSKEFYSELSSNILDAFNELKEHQAGNRYNVTINEKDTTMPEFEVRVTPFEKENSNIKGLVSMKIENCMAVNNLTVKESREGNLYVSMPSYKAKQLDDQGKAVYKDICNPVTAKFGEKLNQAILSSYEAAKENTRNSVLGKLQENKDSVEAKRSEAPEKEKEPRQHERDDAR